MEILGFAWPLPTRVLLFPVESRESSQLIRQSCQLVTVLLLLWSRMCYWFPMLVWPHFRFSRMVDTGRKATLWVNNFVHDHYHHIRLLDIIYKRLACHGTRLQDISRQSTDLIAKLQHCWNSQTLISDIKSTNQHIPSQPLLLVCVSRLQNCTQSAAVLTLLTALINAAQLEARITESNSV